MGKICLLLYLAVMSIFDLRERRVPVVLLAAGLAAAAAAGVYTCMKASGNTVENIIKLGTGMIPGIFLLLTAWLTRKIGWGDGMVLLIVGLARGFRSCAALLCGSILLTAAAGIILLLLRKAGKHTALPYLPFLTAAYLAEIFI